MRGLKSIAERSRPNCYSEINSVKPTSIDFGPSFSYASPGTLRVATHDTDGRQISQGTGHTTSTLTAVVTGDLGGEHGRPFPILSDIIARIQGSLTRARAKDP